MTPTGNGGVRNNVYGEDIFVAKDSGSSFTEYDI